MWDKQPPREDAYILLGIPKELTQHSIDHDSISTVALPVTRLNKKPKAFSGDPQNTLFYGQIDLQDQFSSIDGMSGGPIFSFYRDEKNELRYFLKALQSRWLENSQQIAACPTTILGNILRNLKTLYETEYQNKS